MEKLFSLSHSSSLDKELIEKHSLSESALIDSAAKGAFLAAEEYIRGKDVLFLVGKGNNGCDALEMARLSQGIAKSVSVFLLFSSGNEENMRRRGNLPPSVFVDSISSYDTVVDGVFGFSFHGKLDERTEALFSSINSSRSFIIALDVPSAFCFKADLTVTFMCNKLELYYPENRAVCGRIVKFNPGFPEAEIKDEDGRLLSFSDYFVPPFSLSDYKNTRGHLLVAAGSPKYPGAAVLSSLSAFHSGCGLVTLLSERSVLDRVLSSYPSIMGKEEGEEENIKASAALVGPGWDKGNRTILERIMERGIPFVIDADAVKHVRKGDDFKGKAVITPHLGEYRRLMANLGVDSRDFLLSLKTISGMLDAVITVKTSVVWIVYKETIAVVDGSNPSLGVAGSGDVLAGIIGAFLAAGLSPLEATKNGVLLHQRCGKKLKDELGFYCAEDLIREIGRER